MNEYRSATNANYGSGMTDTFIDSIHGVSRTHTGPSEIHTDGEQSVTNLVRTDKASVILGDKFETVKGGKNVHVGGDYVLRIDGRFTIISGNTDKKYSTQQAWMDASSDLAAARATGQIKRGFYPIGYPQAKEQVSGQNAENPTLTSKFYSVNSTLRGLTTNGSGVTTVSRTSGHNGQGSWATPSDAGSQQSPSTQGGTFEANNIDLASLMTETQTKLTPIERNMPRNDIPFFADNLIFGTSGPPNTRPPGRIDPVGRQEKLSHNIFEKGPATIYQGVPHIEEVDNHSDIPFGNIRFKAGNTFTVEVGNGGINLVTGGGIKMIGNSNTIVGGEQVLIAGTSNIRLQGGKFVGIKGDNIHLESPNQVTMNSLGVEKSAFVGGSMFINGELFVNHITGPAEFYISEVEPEYTYGELVDGMLIGITSDGKNVFAITTPDSVKVNKHKHYYKMVQQSMKDSNNEVRSAAAGNNNGVIPAATAASGG